MSVKMQHLCIRYALDITYQMCFCHLLYPEDMALRDAYSHKIDAKFILKLYILKSVIRSLLPYTFILRILNDLFRQKSSDYFKLYHIL